VTTIAALLRNASARLVSETPRLDAEWLLEFALQKNSAWFLAHGDDELPLQRQEKFFELLERRIAGEPIAHIIGSRGFWTLDLAVTSDTLIPRPETELLVELAIAKCSKDKKLRILDLGTGTGAIALAIASECKNAEVIAVDKSAAVLQVARENSRKNNLQVEFIQSDWFSELANQKFDLLVSNPPYIPDKDPHLLQGDVRFEPLTALASGVDGLDDIRLIVSQARQYCLPEAWLMIEHGFDQGEVIRALFAEAGFINVETVRDLEQRERVTIGQ
jgi:release factor glutamine methyltransferase